MEEYRNFFESYEISNLGNIRRKLKNGKYKNINGSILNNGYKYIQLKRDNKRINIFYHHAVAQTFIGPRPEKRVIDHIDRNQLNNNLSNLRYVTQKENCQNSNRYRSDILETDLKERKRILDKERRSNKK